MKRGSKLVRHILSAAFVLCFVMAGVKGTAFAAATGVNVETHSQEQIREKFRQIYQDHDFEVTYSQKPVISGAEYAAGSLSDETLNGAVDMLNGMRYIAGIPYDVKLSSDYIQMAQAGALVNAANHEMSHNPAKPASMDDGLYQLGYKGCSRSNLYWNVSNFRTAVEGWISDENNVSGFNQGHRRWCLNPSMKYTGFGKVNAYSVMYAFDRQGIANQYTGVAWPAQQMPLDFFDTNIAWSISFDRVINSNNTSVTLTRTRDNKVWNFGGNTSDGRFLVENSYYGQIGCVIFLPNNIDMYLPDDIFHVQVKENGSVIADYDVNFFELYPMEKITLNYTSLKMKEYSEKELIAKVYPDNASDDTVYWESSNPEVVEVYDGYLESYKKGSAIITAKNKYGNVVATCNVKVLSYKEYYKPSKTTIKSVSSGKKHNLKVTWDKVAGSGYQIRYSTSPSFKTYKTVKVTGKSTTSKTISNLKKGKTYYVKVRAYKSVYGENIYGSFSDTKKIRCK